MMNSDCVFISYDEPLADELFRRLNQVFPTPKRLHGVRGMARAYSLSAELVDSDEYFIADGDFEISLEFDPLDVPPLSLGVSMRVWAAENAVNRLTYGYGGLKLCNRDAMRQLEPAVDVLAGIPGNVEFVQLVAGTTRFNQSPFHAWRAGFRECAMLTRGSEFDISNVHAQQIIATWLKPPTCESPYCEWAAIGAADGIAFANVTPRDSHDWNSLNDPHQLAARFASGRTRS